MTTYVRGSFLDSVKAEITNMLPPTIKIPMEDTITIKGFSFAPKNVIVTKNHGLMLTAGMQTITTTGAAR